VGTTINIMTSGQTSIDPKVRFKREIELWATGMDIKDIAKAVGRTKGSLASLIHKHRKLFPLRGKGHGKAKGKRRGPPPEVKYAKAIELWNNTDKTAKQIATELGVTTSSINNAIHGHHHLFKDRIGGPKPVKEPAQTFAKEIALWAEGKPVKEIAVAVGKSKATVQGILANYREFFPPRGKGWGGASSAKRKGIPAEQRLAHEIALWKEGKTPEEIAAAVKRTVPAVAGSIHSKRTRHLFPRRQFDPAAGNEPKRTDKVAPEIRYAKLISLWNAGKTIPEIADETGRSEGNVAGLILRDQKHLFSERIGVLNYPVTQEPPEVLYKAIIEAWNEGLSRPDICQRTGVKYANLTRIINRNLSLFPDRGNGKRSRPESRHREYVDLWHQGFSRDEIAAKLGVRRNRVDIFIATNPALFPERKGDQVRAEVLPPEKVAKIRLKNKKTRGKTSDPTFAWALSSYGPEIEKWRCLAEKYLASIDGKPGYGEKLYAVAIFLENYVGRHKLYEPSSVLYRKQAEDLPPLIGDESAQPGPLLATGTGYVFARNTGGIGSYNRVCDFLAWVLDENRRDSNFHHEEEPGLWALQPGFGSPFLKLSSQGMPSQIESVWAPLPFPFICSLKDILAEGRHFSDWKWAQSAIEADWIEVTDADIVSQLQLPHGHLQRDPDLVLRKKVKYGWKRTSSGRLFIDYDSPRNAVEMWCPTRAVALLLKLEMPLRTFQTRMLDSGEADLERCELIETLGLDGKPNYRFVWSANTRREKLVAGLQPHDAIRMGKKQGVFRKLRTSLYKEDITGFYINTNKTADTNKDWTNRGYVVEWENKPVLRWLIKLRNWQEKYNPIDRPTLWAELSQAHTRSRKSEKWLKRMAPTCFLFRHAAQEFRYFWNEQSRDAERQREDQMKPITDSMVNTLWDRLLVHYEQNLRTSGMLANGEPIKLIKAWTFDGAVSAVYYPLHSLRVSLLTGLAVYGKVKIEILQKLAGHASMRMAIYYAKFGPVVLHEEMESAAKRMASEGEHAVVNFLKQLSYDKIAEKAVIFDPSSLRSCIPLNPTDRNPINWVKVHGGLCMVGCNTCPRMEFNKQVNGCHNGGKVIIDHPTNSSGRVHESVPIMSCVMSLCRFVITGPNFLDELKYWFNIKSAHLPRVEKHLADCVRRLDELQNAKTHAEGSGIVFTRYEEFRETHKLHARAEADHRELEMACHNLLYAIHRCTEVLPATASGEQSLVSFGSKEDVQIVLRDVSSEQLQLSGILLEAKLYPELRNELGEIVLRRSKLLDQMMERNFGQPIYFNMDEDTAIAVGNEIIKKMVKKAQASFAIQYPGQVLPFEHGLEIVCKMSDGPTALPEDMKETIRETLNSEPILKLIGKQTLKLK